MRFPRNFVFQGRRKLSARLETIIQKIPKQEDTAAFKEQAVKRVKEGKSVVAVAKEMGLVEQTLRHWAKAFDDGTLNGAGTAKVAAEAME